MGPAEQVLGSRNFIVLILALNLIYYEWPGIFDKGTNKRAAEFIFSGMFCYGIISFSYIIAKIDKEKSQKQPEQSSDPAPAIFPDSQIALLENQLKMVTEDRDRLLEKNKNLEVSLTLANELIKHNLLSLEGKGTDKLKKGESQEKKKVNPRWEFLNHKFLPMKWKKLRNTEYYYATDDTPYGKSQIVISKKLFRENVWQIRFDELLVGEIEGSDIDEIKRKTVKEYKVWKKKREESGLRKIYCEHDEIDLMLYFGDMALSRIKSIINRDYHTSSIDRHLKQDLDVYKIRDLEERFYQFRQQLKKIYDQWGLEENDPEKAEILYREMIFKI